MQIQASIDFANTVKIENEWMRKIPSWGRGILRLRNKKLRKSAKCKTVKRNDCRYMSGVTLNWVIIGSVRESRYNHAELRNMCLKLGQRPRRNSWELYVGLRDVSAREGGGREAPSKWSFELQLRRSFILFVAFCVSVSKATSVMLCKLDMAKLRLILNYRLETIVNYDPF